MPLPRCGLCSQLDIQHKTQLLLADCWPGAACVSRRHFTRTPAFSCSEDWWVFLGQAAKPQKLRIVLQRWRRWKHWSFSLRTAPWMKRRQATPAPHVEAPGGFPEVIQKKKKNQFFKDVFSTVYFHDSGCVLSNSVCAKAATWDLVAPSYNSFSSHLTTKGTLSVQLSCVFSLRSL